jgi:EAL domain-containing protein (putative c-di-GMP-specific phosphodiesterase class I)
VAIVRAMTDLARALGIRTTAEGVETGDQRRVLLDLGCNEIQGYLISKPRSAASIGNLIEDHDSQILAA